MSGYINYEKKKSFLFVFFPLNHWSTNRKSRHSFFRPKFTMILWDLGAFFGAQGSMWLSNAKLRKNCKVRFAQCHHPLKYSHRVNTGPTQIGGGLLQVMFLDTQTMFYAPKWCPWLRLGWQFALLYPPTINKFLRYDTTPAWPIDQNHTLVPTCITP